jgi:DNA-directed RNA polymerase subunit RPC12/RpoP
MNKKTYKCENCGKEIEVSDETNPDCCGKPMKELPLDICTQPAHAEHARTMERNEPCDDGRAG